MRMTRSKQAEKILGNLLSAVEMLEECPEFSSLMPEVRVNIAYALPEAKTPQDVAAVDGRITVVRGMPHAAGLPRWGASDHMARLLLEVRKYDSSINAGINFKCDAKIIEVAKKYCSERGFLFGWIDRTREPEEVIRRDGTSMPWKIRYLVETFGELPKLFYESEGWGKEPLFVAIGKTAVGVAGIAIEIAQRL
jgi:hydroxymethylpyrimidine/phosphomethylpyrimidine kinase